MMFKINQEQIRFSSFLVILLETVLGDRPDKVEYVVMKEPENWFQALINCKSAGMELANIYNYDEQMAIDKFLKDNGHKSGYWLGGTKLGNNEYYWAPTGDPVRFTRWFGGQPDDGGKDIPTEECIQWGMPTWNPDPSGWNDMKCNSSLSYICQRGTYCNRNADDWE